VYDSVDDIDLFVGGVTEKPLSGGLVGPTFAYIIAKQFENIKQSDPFFYDLVNQRGTFTKGKSFISQLKIIFIYLKKY
jgi:peroxidase